LFDGAAFNILIPAIEARLCMALSPNNMDLLGFHTNIANKALATI
jgi:hypothetical protein